MVRDYRPKHQKWQPGIVQMQAGTKSYHMDVSGGTTAWRRHADQTVKTPDGMHLEQPDKGDKLQEDETVQTEEVQAPVNVEATLQNNESQSTCSSAVLKPEKVEVTYNGRCRHPIKVTWTQVHQVWVHPLRRNTPQLDLQFWKKGRPLQLAMCGECVHVI